MQYVFHWNRDVGSCGIHLAQMDIDIVEPIELTYSAHSNENNKRVAIIYLNTDNILFLCI